MASFYVTTAIPYVNAAPHLGFALELVQADVLARYHRLCGEDTWFLTGTDENSLTNVLAAEQEGVPVRSLVDRNAGVFQALAHTLHIRVERGIGEGQGSWACRLGTLLPGRPR
jgi:methionyl-tRNA synthetase